MCSTGNYIQYPVINQNGKESERRTTVWCNNSIPRHILRENHNSKRFMHPSIHCSTIYNCQNMEATETEEWINKMWYVCVCMCVCVYSAIPHSSVVNLPAMQDTWVWFLGWEDPLQKEMATYSSILAWRIPWTEETGRLQSPGLQESDMTYWLKRERERWNWMPWS